MIKQIYLLMMLLTFGSMHQVQAQQLISNSVRLIDNLPRNYTAGKKVYGKTTSCPSDTVKYTFYKATALNAVSLNNTTSGNRFVQYFDAPQSITISGFDFYGWQSTNTNQVVNLDCKLYLANPLDSTPTGTALASVSVPVDSTFGGGVLTALLHQANFGTPVTVTGPYILSVETSSSVSVSIVANSWTASPPNGRNEWLSSVHFGTNSFYSRSYTVNVGGIQFNADFLYQPYVTYSLSADFQPSTFCNQGGVPISFTNNSSPVLFNKFYNTRAYYNITYVSCMWDYGDSTGIWYALNGNRTYNYRVPYNVKLRDTIIGWTTGCGDSRSIPLSAAPPPVQAKSNAPVCSGSTLKLFADTLVGANGYYWTGPNGYTSTLQNPVISNAGVIHQGTYSVRAIMGQCTSAVATTVISIQSTPQAASNSPLCVGQTLSLTISAVLNGIYSWTGPNGFTSSLQSPSKTNITLADTGTYQVTVTSPGCGLLGPYPIQVQINTVPPAPTATNNGPLCVGDNLNLTSSGVNGDYQWSGPNGFTAFTQNLSRSLVQASMAGVYAVTVAQNGCRSSSSITTVVINNAPATPVASNNGPLCSGQTLSLTASLISGATYQWSGPNGFVSTLQNPVRNNLTLLDGGTYSVIAKANGCSSAAGNTSVSISTSTPTPTASSNAPLCPGQTLQLNASNIPGATYSWTGPNSFTSTQQNPSITNIASLNAGTYSVTALTSGCGVSSAGNVTVLVNNLPSAPIVANNGPLCDGDSLVLDASFVTGASYTWSGPNGFASNLQKPVIKNVNSVRAGQYSVIVDVNGCGTSAPASTNVEIRRVPQAPSIGGVTAVCEGDTLKLNGTSFGTGPACSYTWSGPNNFSAGQKNIAIGSAGINNAGFYSLLVTDSGCKSPSSATNVTIKNRPASPLASNTSPVCTGNDVQLSASPVSGGNYKWSGPNNYLSSSQNPSLFGFTGFASGTYTVIVSVNGCSSLPAQTNVFLYPLPPPPIASNDGPQCVGNPVSLFANPVPNVQYSWTGPNGFTSTNQNPILPNAKVGMSGIYSLTLIDSHCVSTPDTTLVTINTAPIAPIATVYPADGKFCSGDSIQLYATFMSNTTYEWSGPGGFGSFVQNPVIRNSTPINNGVYQVIAIRNNCQSPPNTVSVSVRKSPETGPIFGADSSYSGETKLYQISGDSGSIFNWVSFGGILQGVSTGTDVNVKWGNPGTGFVRVRETGVTGCKGPLIQQNVVITKQPVSGILNESDLSNLTIFPNPSDLQVNVQFNLHQAAICELVMYNLLGEEVWTLKDRFESGNASVIIPTTSIPSGIYMLKLTNGNTQRDLKIEVIH